MTAHSTPGTDADREAFWAAVPSEANGYAPEPAGTELDGIGLDGIDLAGGVEWDQAEADAFTASVFGDGVAAGRAIVARRLVRHALTGAAVYLVGALVGELAAARAGGVQ